MTGTVCHRPLTSWEVICPHGRFMTAECPKATSTGSRKSALHSPDSRSVLSPPTHTHTEGPSRNLSRLQKLRRVARCFLSVCALRAGLARDCRHPGVVSPVLSSVIPPYLWLRHPWIQPNPGWKYLRKKRCLYEHAWISHRHSLTGMHASSQPRLEYFSNPEVTDSLQEDACELSTNNLPFDIRGFLW